MKKPAPLRDWLPLAKPAGAAPAPPLTGDAFRPEWFDFEHGIRVGNLEPHERITRILRAHLESTYRTPFITDRWGRGVYWQWICWLPRANREAKPLSSKVNFGCAKLFVTVDRGHRAVKAGLQVERGYAEPPEPYPGCLLREDWDWHRLVTQCREGSELDSELHRLIGREEFTAEVGDWEANAVFDRRSFSSARQIGQRLERYPRRQWVGFQLYYAIPETEVRKSSGLELTRALCAVFDEVVPAMNACMQVPLQGAGVAAEAAGAGLGGPAGTFRRRRPR
jgi:hypothetical protein